MKRRTKRTSAERSTGTSFDVASEEVYPSWQIRIFERHSNRLPAYVELKLNVPHDAVHCSFAVTEDELRRLRDAFDQVLQRLTPRPGKKAGR